MTHIYTSISDRSAAECAQDDETYWQECAAQAGRTCYDMADAIASLLDCHDSEWSADAQPRA
jgi:hypothetical protein